MKPPFVFAFVLCGFLMGAGLTGLISTIRRNNERLFLKPQLDAALSVAERANAAANRANNAAESANAVAERANNVAESALAELRKCVGGVSQ